MLKINIISTNSESGIQDCFEELKAPSVDTVCHCANANSGTRWFDITMLIVP